MTVKTSKALPVAKRQLVCSDDAEPARGQHKTPCADCPWGREALPGWTGSMTSDEWVQAAHSEARIDCHTLMGAQCAGAAIYRRNVAKNPRDKSLLILDADREKVFSNPMEFKAHHGAGSGAGMQGLRDSDEEDERAGTNVEAPPCYLCRAPVDLDNKESDFGGFCKGCGKYICSDHFGSPLGPHRPEEHEEEDVSYDDEDDL